MKSGFLKSQSGVVKAETLLFSLEDGVIIHFYKRNISAFCIAKRVFK